MSNYLAQKVIQYTLENISFTPVATDYVGLGTTNSSASAVGTEVTTTQLTGYARQSIAASAVGWNYATNAVSNALTLTYTASAATTGSLPSPQTMFVNDALTTGNNYVWSNFSAVTIALGNTVQVNVAGLTVTSS